MGARSRRKGAAGEREAVALLRAVAPHAYRAASAQRAGDARVCDVEGTPWWVEVKRGRRTSPRAALAQAVADADAADDPRCPVALTRDDGGEWTVTMRACDWLRWMRAALTNGDDE